MISKRHVVAIVQARMGSTRFPHKVVQPIYGRKEYNDFVEGDPLSVLELLCLRLAASEHLDEIVVAVPANDFALQHYCHSLAPHMPIPLNVAVGSEENVLDRVAQAARDYKADIIVDVTADCPFVDPEHVDLLIDHLNKNGLDYCSNVMTRTWPDGFDVQVYTLQALEQLIGHFPVNTEHTGWNFIQHKDGFKCFNFAAPLNRPAHPEWELTVDHPQDLQLLRILLRMVLEGYDSDEFIEGLLFEAGEVIEILEQFPELLLINKGLHRKEESNPTVVEERSHVPDPTVAFVQCRCPGHQPGEIDVEMYETIVRKHRRHHGFITPGDAEEKKIK